MAGCGGEPSAAPVPTVGTASPAAAARSAPSPDGPPRVATPDRVFRTGAVEVGPVVWAGEIDPETKAPRAPVEAFAPESRRIYAALPLPRLAPGTEIRATWSYNGTPLDGFGGSVTTERAERDLWVEFHLELVGDATWPTGTYAIDVRVNGEPAQTASVRVIEG